MEQIQKSKRCISVCHKNKTAEPFDDLSVILHTHTHTASHTKPNLEIRGLPEASNKSTHRCSDLALVSLYHLSRPLGKICFLQHTESPR